MLDFYFLLCHHSIDGSRVPNLQFITMFTFLPCHEKLDQKEQSIYLFVTNTLKSIYFSQEHKVRRGLF